MKVLLLALFGIFFLGPIFVLFTKIDPILFQETLSSKSFLKSLNVTLISGFGGAVLSAIFGVYFAHFFSKYQWKFKRIQRLGFLIPYLIPNCILAAAFVVAWNPVSGILTSSLPFPGELYGTWGMTFIFGVVHAPLVFLILEDKMQKIDPVFFEASQVSGANSVKTFFKIELPLLLPAILSAMSLCFSLNISAFAIPAWIGAPEKAYALTYKVYQTLQLGGEDGISQSAGLSLILFLLAIPSLALNVWIQKSEKKYLLITGKASRKMESIFTSKKFYMFQASYVFCMFIFWILPLAVLFLSTFVKPGCLQQNGLACFQDASLKSYEYILFELPDTKQALTQSLIYGTLSGILIITLSLIALMFFSNKKTFQQTLEWFFAIPIATPGAILALGLIVSYSGQFGINLYNTAWIAVVAYVLKHMNMAFLPIRNGLMNIHASLVEAAQISGASKKRAWKDIVVPILKPDIMGVFFLVLIPILGELTMSVFLASPNFKSIGSVLFELQDYADQASASALSIVLVLLILFMNQITRWLSRGKLGY